MSERFPGGFITNNPTAPTTTSAPGIWTLDQATQYIKAGTWPYGGPFNYIEDVFQTWLYKGNSSTQTITNGIDLSTYGGLFWQKIRSGANDNNLFDTANGANYYLNSNQTAAQSPASFLSFTSTGVNYSSISANAFNESGQTYVSWTFRKQAKFFDVVTFTAPASGTITVNHNLGSVPGCVITKSTGISQFWIVNHRSLSSNQYLILNTADSVQSGAISYTATSTTITFSAGYLNANQPYVMYLFAHDAGGFGSTNTDNVISCGSYTGTGSAQTLSLGYEPQWVLIKQSSGVNAWNIWDNMRGMVVGGTDAYLQPNTSNAENSLGAYDFLSPTATGLIIDPTSSGYNYVNTNGATYIYIAIRRGPMKTPTSGTSIYGTQLQVNTPTYSFPPDLIWATNRTGNATYSNWFVDRLRGSGRVIRSYSTGAETAESYSTFSPDGANNSWGPGWTGGANYEVSGFRRAPGFFDVVCYTGDGTSNKSITHNLGVAPEFLVVKSRSNVENWNVYDEDIASPLSNILFLNNTNGSSNYSNYWGTSAPTSTTFNVGNYSGVNGSGQTYVAYLFASVAGVSKVGSYSGTGATQTISCGFAARFVMIKRTDSTGNWVVWDTARGMVAGTDPRLELNTTNAETNANWVYTDASGFQIVTTDATVNASGGTYIFLAIA